LGSLAWEIGALIPSFRELLPAHAHTHARMRTNTEMLCSLRQSQRPPRTLGGCQSSRLSSLRMEESFSGRRTPWVSPWLGFWQVVELVEALVQLRACL
jgi:hypothetical protein